MGTSQWITSFAILLAFLAQITSCSTKSWMNSSNVPAMFIFGDSLADTGTNNYIENPLVPQADIVPYGMSFFPKPTGRWSNGRLVFDFLASDLSIPFPEPYLRRGPTFFRGGNFASAGSGILDTTSAPQGVISLSVQIQQFEEAVANLTNQLGNLTASYVIDKSIYVLCTGSNDFSAYVANSTLKNETTPSQYIDLLISKLEGGILTIMATGARKIVVSGLGPLGCTPRVLGSANSTGGCVDSLNQLTQAFNGALAQLVAGLNSKLNTSTILFANPYDVTNNLIHNGASQGFTQGSTSCCGGGPYNGIVECGRGNYTLCADVTKYVFWDYTHPTERIYKIIADLFWSGNNSFINPMNIQRLAALD